MSLQFKVPSMVCDGCMDTVTKAIQSVNANAQVNISLETKQVQVDSQASMETLKEAITAKGHTVD